MIKKCHYLVIICVLSICQTFAQKYIPNDTIIYKKTPQGELALHVFYPEDYSVNDSRSAIVSFFGGGWTGGHPRQFYQQSTFFAKLGMVAISAEYRVKKIHKTSPFESVQDGKSAIRWVRQNAKKIGVDPNRIVACGGSAGGHVAACTGVIQGQEVTSEDLLVSSVPNAMILFNPVLDTTEKGYGAEKVKGRETEISPCHQVKENAPPSLVFHGTKDLTVPFENAERFERLMKQKGNECLLVPAFGMGHGFFNSSWFRKTNTDASFKYTMYKSEAFLWKHGFIEKEPSDWDIEFNSPLFPKPKLDSKSYHKLRGGLKNSQIKFTKDKRGTVAFLGGSITFNKGWRNKVCDYLKQKFPETVFTFIEAGIPSEGSTSGAFRLVRDVLSKGDVDLLFEEAAVNDRSPGLRRNSIDRVRGMEGIVRHARKINPTMDIVVMHFVDPSKMEKYRAENVPQEIADHESVAEHYKLSSINLAKEVTERIDAGEFTWEDDFKNLHPSPFGQEVYACSMKTLLENAYFGFVADDDKVTAYELPEKLNEFAYDNGTFLSIDKAKYKNGWELDPSWEPTNNERVRRGYTKIPLLVANGDKGWLKLNFTGSAIGMIALSGPDAGTIEYSIDGSEYQLFDQYTTNSYYQHLPRYFVLASELDAQKKHTIKIRMAKIPNSQSEGNACRIYSFFTN
ncbi:alpha/beta hydrolase fold domain-containing protein [Tamlana sp. 2201CG12-4]|uniref:alpha/beta hydrolase fold domain-containing protein n=1 Tax=Tamlana sp. 2201CG12-4 TaxID=3112582 RepID=UPI002DB931D6|nr:alpha/beta hydrolase fold domain-containing protein [Tamlana sp. 2201CG12-4]MEC3907227.1 alpha/beta hydrolase fold domain-containing protein [Tamlana sp. 2201CG12-4]